MIEYLPEMTKVKGTLTDKAYFVLKKAIIELKLNPGTLLLEEELSEQMGVSRTPIHSALNKLAHEGLVNILKGKGSVVAPLTVVELQNLFTVRKALECLAVRLCVEEAGSDELREISYLLQWQKETFSGEKVDIINFLQSDTEFHLLLAKIANNAYLLGQLKMTLEMSRRYVTAYTADNLPPIVLEEHRAIYEHIKARQTERAVAMVESHLDAVMRRISADIQEAERIQQNR